MEELLLEIQELEKSLNECKDEYTYRKGQKEKLISVITENKIKLAEKEERTDFFTRTKLLLEKSAEFSREQAKTQLESIVTSALQIIFDDMDLEFVIEINGSRGKPNADFYVVSNIGGHRIKEAPEDACGGGVVDVISLALRIAYMECLGIQGPIVLDEPTKHVSFQYSRNVAIFVKDMNNIYKRQNISITHSNYLGESADKVFNVRLKDGASKVIAVEDDIE